MESPRFSHGPHKCRLNGVPAALGSNDDGNSEARSLQVWRLHIQGLRSLTTLLLLWCVSLHIQNPQSRPQIHQHCGLGEWYLEKCEQDPFYSKVDCTLESTRSICVPVACKRYICENGKLFSPTLLVHWARREQNTLRPGANI